MRPIHIEIINDGIEHLLWVEIMLREGDLLFGDNSYYFPIGFNGKVEDKFLLPWIATAGIHPYLRYRQAVGVSHQWLLSVFGTVH